MLDNVRTHSTGFLGALALGYPVMYLSHAIFGSATSVSPISTVTPAIELKDPTSSLYRVKLSASHVQYVSWAYSGPHKWWAQSVPFAFAYRVAFRQFYRRKFSGAASSLWSNLQIGLLSGASAHILSRSFIFGSLVTQESKMKAKIPSILHPWRLPLLHATASVGLCFGLHDTLKPTNISISFLYILQAWPMALLSSMAASALTAPCWNLAQVLQPFSSASIRNDSSFFYQKNYSLNVLMKTGRTSDGHEFRPFKGLLRPSSYRSNAALATALVLFDVLEHWYSRR